MSAQRGSSSAVVLWDVRVARAAMVATSIAFAIALVVTAATDEGGVSWLERLARSLAALPVCAGFGAWLALFGRRSRGELRAWASLGRSPLRAGLPAALGAFAVASLLSVFVTRARSFDVATFFPKAAVHTTLQWNGEGFVDGARTTMVKMDGALVLLPAPETRTGAGEGTTGAGAETVAAASGGAAAATSTGADAGLRVVICAVMLLTSLSLALVGARGDPSAGELAAVALLLLLTVMVFHLAAIGRVPLATCTAAPIVLIVFSGFRYGATR